MAVSTIRILLIAAITFLQNSRHGRILFTARFLITTKRGRVIDRKRLALFLGSMKLTKARLFRPAKVVGSRFAKVTASRMRSGKMPDLSAPITGNMFLVRSEERRVGK